MLDISGTIHHMMVIYGTRVKQEIHFTEQLGK